MSIQHSMTTKLTSKWQLSTFTFLDSRCAELNKMSWNNIQHPGFNLGHSTWSMLNRFCTGQGRCAAHLHKWHMASSDKCQCGGVQTMSHIIESCPLTGFDGDLLRIHSADDCSHMASHSWWLCSHVASHSWWLCSHVASLSWWLCSHVASLSWRLCSHVASLSWRLCSHVASLSWWLCSMWLQNGAVKAFAKMKWHNSDFKQTWQQQWDYRAAVAECRQL